MKKSYYSCNLAGKMDWIWELEHPALYTLPNNNFIGSFQKVIDFFK
jgi:hypothetical protein